MEKIFQDLFKCRTLTIRVVPFKSPEISSERMYKEFLQLRYREVFKLCLDQCLVSEKPNEAQQALETLFKFISYEAKYPLEEAHGNKQESTFPVQSLSRVLLKVLFAPSLMKRLIVTVVSQYTLYKDFNYYAWKIILKLITPNPNSDFNSTFIQNFIEMLNILIPNSIGDDEEKQEMFLCKEVSCDDQTLKRNINKACNHMIQWQHSETTQRQMLFLLVERQVLAYLDKPQLLTDYLMDCLDVGGSVSLLALQLIFILIHKYNMSYPNIYKKLYAMFEPESFHMKFKPRLFYLGDIFLSSSFLPEMLVAAFAKRLARLSLIAPPQDITIIIYFIANLIIRHPGLKRLLISQHSNQEREVSEDVYLMDESDPNSSRAIESSLWEIQLLQNHMLPNVSQSAKNLLSQPLSQEYNIGEYLELKENDLFDREISAKSKEYALTFERPLADVKNNQAQSSALTKYWKF